MSVDGRSRLWLASTTSRTLLRRQPARSRKPSANTTDNDRLKAEGQTDQAKASTKQGATDVKDAAHGVADSFKDNK